MRQSTTQVATSLARIQADPSLMRSLQQQMHRVTADASDGVFQVAPCQRGPKHNCELNISN